MTEIIPAIIGQDFAEIQSKISRVENLVTWAQLDIMDGLFVPEFSWQNSTDLTAITGKIKLEAHLMIEEPENWLADWVMVCDRVIVHLESTNQLPQIIEKMRDLPVELSLAVLLETPLAKLAPFISEVKRVQLMGIATIGHHGEPLDERIYERIKFLRQTYPGVKISIDGGVNLETAPKLITAGADALVVGSTLWQAKDLETTINALRRQN